MHYGRQSLQESPMDFLYRGSIVGGLTTWQAESADPFLHLLASEAGVHCQGMAVGRMAHPAERSGTLLEEHRHPPSILVRTRLAGTAES